MRPERPRDDETAIEALYRLNVSPSDRGAFAQSVQPAGPADAAGQCRGGSGDQML